MQHSIGLLLGESKRERERESERGTVVLNGKSLIFAFPQKKIDRCWTGLCVCVCWRCLLCLLWMFLCILCMIFFIRSTREDAKIWRKSLKEKNSAKKLWAKRREKKIVELNSPAKRNNNKKKIVKLGVLFSMLTSGRLSKRRANLKKVFYGFSGWRGNRSCERPLRDCLPGMEHLLELGERERASEMLLFYKHFSFVWDGIEGVHMEAVKRKYKSDTLPPKWTRLNIKQPKGKTTRQTYFVYLYVYKYNISTRP